jgi:hypothetical protein
MTTIPLSTRLAALQGCQVNVALRGGERIDDCQLVSAVRTRAATLWLFTNGVDTFVPVDHVADVWAAA